MSFLLQISLATHSSVSQHVRDTYRDEILGLARALLRRQRPDPPLVREGQTREAEDEQTSREPGHTGPHCRGDELLLPRVEAVLQPPEEDESAGLE